MSAEMLGWLGIVIAVIFGVAGFFAVKSIRKKSQNQRIGRGGTGYQAGGDINIDKKP